MPKAVPDAVLDQMFDYIIANCDQMCLCQNTSAPTNASVAYSTANWCLATRHMVAGDFAKADAAGGGRKLTINLEANASIQKWGTNTAYHVALVDKAGDELLYVTTCTAQSVTGNGTNTVTFPEWTITIGDPV